MLQYTSGQCCHGKHQRPPYPLVLYSISQKTCCFVTCLLVSSLPFSDVLGNTTSQKTCCLISSPCLLVSSGVSTCVSSIKPDRSFLLTLMILQYYCNKWKEKTCCEVNIGKITDTDYAMTMQTMQKIQIMQTLQTTQTTQRDRQQKQC